MALKLHKNRNNAAVPSMYHKFDHCDFYPNVSVLLSHASIFFPLHLSGNCSQLGRQIFDIGDIVLKF